jgi:hypothetical protein
MQVSQSPEALAPLELPWLEGLGPLLAACGTLASSSSSAATTTSSSSGSKVALYSRAASSHGKGQGGSLRVLGALLELQEGVAALQQAAAAGGGVEVGTQGADSVRRSLLKSHACAAPRPLQNHIQWALCCW